MHSTLSKISLSLILLISLLYSGCQKSPINGDLDGQWQVMEVNPEPSEIIIDKRLYMCFSLHTVQLTYYGNGPWTPGNILKFDDKHLVLDFPYATAERSIALLRQYGIYNNPVTFDVEMLTSSKLILRDGDVVVTLRKF